MSGFVGNGGFNFSTTKGNTRRGQSRESIMYDDREYDERMRDRGRGSDRGGARGSDRGGKAPLRGIGSPERQRAQSASARRDDYYGEDFDDYRPGSRFMVEGRELDSYDSFRRDRQDRDDFDDDDFGDASQLSDDFDNGYRNRYSDRRRDTLRDDYDDIDRGRPSARGGRRPEPRGGRAPQRQRGRGRRQEPELEDKYDGLRGIGGSYADELPEPMLRSELSSSGGHGTAPQYDDYEVYDDPDGYYGRATIRDKGYEGQGVPKIFAQYFPDDDGYDQRDRSRYRRPAARVSGGRQHMPRIPVSYDRKHVKNNVNPGTFFERYGRILATVIAVSLTAGALAYGISYLALFRTTSPLNVSTALTAMQDNVSNTLLRSSVDRQLSLRNVQVSVGGQISTLSLADCEFRFSSDGDGDEHKEWGKSVSGTDVQYTYMTRGSIRFNETKVKDFLHQASGGEAVRMVEPDYKVDIMRNRDTNTYDGTLTITEGSNGYGIDFGTFIDELMRHIAADDSSPITAELTETVAPAVDIDKIYDSVHTEAADAYKRTDGSGEVVYEKEVIGVDFDKRAAAEKIAGGGGKWVINLALTIPKVSRKALMAETFPDLLATYSTPFNANNQARSSNLALAGDYINGTVLQPGDVFSYNKTVGERTRERGFCKATVYSSEGTDEDYGGGICQTSSTLFYAAMKANLELVKRTNHLYTVMYMVDEKGNTGCFGNDATVNWPNVDMQFRNNKEYPIKIECITKNGIITFNIWGTWDGYTAEYRYVEKERERYQVIYRKYKEGKKNQAGQLGRTIWTYRVVFYQEEQGVGEKKEVDRKREFISTYRPLSQIKYVTSPPAGYEFDIAYNN